MTIPLVVLGSLSLVAGLLNPEALHALGIHALDLRFEHWLAPGIEEGVPAVALAATRRPLELPLVGASSVIALASIGIAWSWYGRGPSRQAEWIVERVPDLHSLVADKWRIDELYEKTVVRTVRLLARGGADLVDRILIDGVLVHGTAGTVKLLGRLLRLAQTGRVQVYAMVMAVGTTGILYKLAVPATDFEATVEARTLEAAATAGAGYEYRWDFDGDGRWDTQFSSDRRVQHRFREPGEHTVRLEVRNPFWSSIGEREVVVRDPRRRGSTGRDRPGRRRR